MGIHNCEIFADFIVTLGIVKLTYIRHFTFYMVVTRDPSLNSPRCEERIFRWDSRLNRYSIAHRYQILRHIPNPTPLHQTFSFHQIQQWRPNPRLEIETTGMLNRESGSENNLPHPKHVLFTLFTRRHKHYAVGFGPMVFLPTSTMHVYSTLGRNTKSKSELFLRHLKMKPTHNNHGDKNRRVSGSAFRF